MIINKDQVAGRVKQAAGKTKEKIGDVVGNKSLQAKGSTEEIVGSMQAKVGDVKSRLKKK